LGLGAIAGAGHHLARKHIKRGDVELGILESYLWASMSENITLGEAPFEHVRYGIGPFSVRLNTKNYKYNFETDLFDLAQTLYVISQNDVKNIKLKHNVIVAEDNGLTGELGMTNGSFVRVLPSTLTTFADHVIESTLRHEIIHVSQNIQWTAFGSKQLGKYKLNENFRVGWFFNILQTIDISNNKSDQLFEKEASQNCDLLIGFGMNLVF